MVSKISIPTLGPRLREPAPNSRSANFNRSSARTRVIPPHQGKLLMLATGDCRHKADGIARVCLSLPVEQPVGNGLDALLDTPRGGMEDLGGDVTVWWIDEPKTPLSARLIDIALQQIAQETERNAVYGLRSFTVWRGPAIDDSGPLAPLAQLVSSVAKEHHLVFVLDASDATTVRGGLAALYEQLPWDEMPPATPDEAAIQLATGVERLLSPAVTIWWEGGARMVATPVGKVLSQTLGAAARMAASAASPTTLTIALN